VCVCACVCVCVVCVCLCVSLHLIYIVWSISDHCLTSGCMYFLACSCEVNVVQGAHWQRQEFLLPWGNAGAGWKVRSHFEGIKPMRIPKEVGSHGQLLVNIWAAASDIWFVCSSSEHICKGNKLQGFSWIEIDAQLKLELYLLSRDCLQHSVSAFTAKKLNHIMIWRVHLLLLTVWHKQACRPLWVKQCLDSYLFCGTKIRCSQECDVESMLPHSYLSVPCKYLLDSMHSPRHPP